MKKRFGNSLACFLVVLIIFSFSMDSVVGATSNSDINENSSVEDMLETMQKYIQQDKDGKLIFNVDKAIEEEQSDFIIESGKEFNALSNHVENKKESQSAAEILRGMPVWGNWCGPGHGGGVPKDKLDSLCMTHDLCYKVKGYFDCGCDKALVAGITATLPFMKSAEKRAALAVAAYFSIAPCKK